LKRPECIVPVQRHEKDTWHRKIRLHDAYQDQVHERHRVVVVTTRSKARLAHILDAAASFVKNPQRTLSRLDVSIARLRVREAACFYAKHPK
jgi:hypothetical protein